MSSLRLPVKSLSLCVVLVDMRPRLPDFLIP